MSNVPNLDCMDAPELWALWRKWDHASRAECAELVGRLPGYTRVVSSLAGYAANKAAAMQCRAKGQVSHALIHERNCERIYESLPECARW